MSEDTVKEQPNRAIRRETIRYMSKKVQANLYGCGTCKLPYIGKVRCQCKAEVKARHIVEAA